VSRSKVKNREVALTTAAFEFSYDMKSLFVIGTQRTNKWGSFDRDCFIIRASLLEPNLVGTGVNGRLSGGYFGTSDTNEKCNSIATNRYD
jgi:hypothetical protein